jgi:hypothetical protein
MNTSLEYKATVNLIPEEVDTDLYTIEIEEETPAVPEVVQATPDVHLDTDIGLIQIYTVPGSNAITNSKVDVDSPFTIDIHDRVLKFRPGHNIHSMISTWGQIDQLSLRRQRYLRLLAFTNMVERSEYLNILCRGLQENYQLLERQFNKLINQLRRESTKLSFDKQEVKRSPGRPQKIRNE